MSGKFEAEPREPWEQQEGENSTVFSHFIMYRDMRYPKITRNKYGKDGKPTGETFTTEVMDGTVPYEKRSLRKLAATLGVNLRTIARQSDTWNWVKRCEAYDAYVDRKNREANEAAIKKMYTEHALLAQQMIRKATRRMTTIPDDQISAAELVRMVDVAVKVERLSRGESTEVREITGEVTAHNTQQVDLSELSDEDLRRLIKLGEMGGGADGEDV